MDEKVLLAQEMRNEGKTLQEIADALGYKSRSAIANIIKRAEQTSTQGRAYEAIVRKRRGNHHYAGGCSLPQESIPKPHGY